MTRTDQETMYTSSRGKVSLSQAAETKSASDSKILKTEYFEMSENGTFFVSSHFLLFLILLRSMALPMIVLFVC